MDKKGYSDSKSGKKKTPDRWRRIQFIAILSFLLMLIVIGITMKDPISIETLASQNTDSPVRTAVLLLLLFGIKSLTIVIPLSSLYVASGMLYSPIIAVFVSLLGLTIALTLPYILGRWSGTEEVTYIRNKYPKMNTLLSIQKRNEGFAAFIIRLIGWLPCDVISFYFGACRANYPIYLISSLGGSLIGLTTNTLLGDVLLDPLSRQFAMLILVKLLISATAVVIAYLINRQDLKKK